MARVIACVAGSFVLACASLLHAQAVSFDVLGPSAGSAFGDALAVVGDVNGDGFPDLAVGAPFDVAAGSPLVTDGFTGSMSIVSGLDGSTLVTAAGTESSELYGWSVAAAGDVNGDGVPDVLVGAPNWHAFRGRVEVISGSGGVLLTLTGNSDGDRFGWSVAPLGDLNGDGHADVAVGAWNDAIDLAGQGVVTAFSGANGQPLKTWKGVNAFDHFGSALAAPGDVDLDGVPDLAIAGELMDAVAVDGGGVVLESVGLGMPMESWFGAISGDQFGHALAGPGDATGDGVPDLLVGAPSASDLSGHAYLLNGATAALVLTINAQTAGAMLGTSVGAIGDLDGDGLADIAVGAPLNGLPTAEGPGVAAVYSSATGNLLLSLDGTILLAGAGSAVAGADFDLDGKPDLAVGVPFEGGGATPSGEVRFVSGDNWVNIGVGVPGSEGVPQMLAQGEPVAGQPVSFTLDGALPGAPAILIVGLSELGSKFKSGTLVPHPDWFSPILLVDAGGSTSLGGTWPAGIPAGIPLWFQWWLADPAAAKGWAGTVGIKVLSQ